jgi:hypothetical protein
MCRCTSASSYFKLGTLSLDLAQPGGFTSLHAAKMLLTLVEGRIAETVLPARLLGRMAGLGLPQEADDLSVGESALLHARSLLGKRTLLTLVWATPKVQGTDPTAHVSHQTLANVYVLELTRIVSLGVMAPRLRVEEVAACQHSC